MASKIPTGLVSIGELSSHGNREVNLMGVVTDFLPRVKSKGTDWMCNFRLADSTAFDDGVKVRLFRPMEVELPRLERNGDVVILERIKITSWSGMTMGLSTLTTRWTVFPVVSIPEKAPSGLLNLKYLSVKSQTPTQEQMKYAIDLCNSRARDPYDASASATNSTSTPTSTAATSNTPSFGRRDKFALIKDVQLDTFYDLVGQVVKIYPGNGVVELYLTDYTPHPLLYNYEWGRDDPDAAGDDVDAPYGSTPSTRRKWPGPFGKYTLTVSLFPPHSYFAKSHVSENQFVFLRNVRIRWSKDGKMEGSLHTDSRYSDRIDVTIIQDRSDDRVKDTLRRKLEYGKKFQHQQEAFNQQQSKESENHGEAVAELARGQKRKQAEHPKLSKTEQRKRKKKKQEEARLKRFKDLAASENEDDKENTDPYQVHITPNPVNWAENEEQLTPLTSPPPAKPPKKPNNLNKNIRTSKPDVPPRLLSSILSLSTHAFTTPSGIPYTLPFQNIKSRAVVRIVDFLPPDIADFAIRKKKNSEFDVLSECSSDSSSSDNDHRQLPDDTDNDDDGRDARSEPGNDENSSTRGSKWQWRFALVLEDASSPRSKSPVEPSHRLTAYMTDADAVFLLKLDACNLRRRPQALAALREKLFLLWGDLEERKKDGSVKKEGTPMEAKSMPFECCIKEYGVRARNAARQRPESGDEIETDETEGAAENWGWERRFAMFGTTIL